MYLPHDTDDDIIYVFATKGGAPTNPDWYYNLTAGGEGSVERGTESYKVTVRELTGAERDRVYAEQARRYPGFAEYERQTRWHPNHPRARAHPRVGHTTDPAQGAQITASPLRASLRLKLAVPSSTFAAGELGLRLLDPAGTKLVDTTATAGGVWLVESATAGTYKVVLDPAGTAAGTAAVQVQQVSDLATQAATVGGSAVSSTFQPGQNGTVTFTATAGQRLKLAVPSSTFAAGELGLRLLDPAGTKLVDTTATAAGVWLFQANKKGTYKVVLDPAGIATGTASVTVAVQ